MPNESITIEVSEKAARAFAGASPRERARVQRLVELSLMAREEAADALAEIMDGMARTATERGLTEDELHDILHDD